MKYINFKKIIFATFVNIAKKKNRIKIAKTCKNSKYFKYLLKCKYSTAIPY